MSSNAASELIDFGQSLWYDNISRQLIDSGELARLISEYGIRGLTSNPTIFDNAISKSSVYDAFIAKYKGKADPQHAYEALAIRDVGDAADLLRPVFDSSKGSDGFVSIEVSPLLARDSKGTVEEAKRLYAALHRPNIMIKVPGTPEGLPAVQQLLELGININITLLFSVENYVEVAKTYCRALHNRAQRGEDVSKIRSVASFFVSRVDTAIDKKLEAVIAKGGSSAEEAKSLQGKFGVANSRIAYRRFEEIFYGAEFAALRTRGASVQRPLWASTGVKNPAYRDTLYVEELIGPETVNTVPHDTLMAFANHGKLGETVKRDLAEAQKMEEKLASLGINVSSILKELQVDGVKKFTDSFEALSKTISQKFA